MTEAQRQDPAPLLLAVAVGPPAELLVEHALDATVDGTVRARSFVASCLRFGAGCSTCCAPSTLPSSLAPRRGLPTGSPTKRSTSPTT